MLRMHFWESGAALERPGSADSAGEAEGHGSVNEVDRGPRSSPSLFLQPDSAAAAAQVEGEERVRMACIHRGHVSPGNDVLFSLGHVWAVEGTFCAVPPGSAAE